MARLIPLILQLLRALGIGWFVWKLERAGAIDAGAQAVTSGANTAAGALNATTTVTQQLDRWARLDPTLVAVGGLAVLGLVLVFRR